LTVPFSLFDGVCQAAQLGGKSGIGIGSLDVTFQLGGHGIPPAIRGVGGERRFYRHLLLPSGAETGRRAIPLAQGENGKQERDGIQGGRETAAAV
jgi:hypothetical protein